MKLIAVVRLGLYQKQSRNTSAKMTDTGNGKGYGAPLSLPIYSIRTCAVLSYLGWELRLRRLTQSLLL